MVQMMRKLIVHKLAEYLRVHGRLTRQLLADGSGIAPSAVSVNLTKLVEAGCVIKTTSDCKCCGTRVDWFEFVKQPITEVERPRAKPKRRKKPKDTPPEPVQPTQVTLPVHDGSVFGMMAAQLGVKK